MTKLPDCPICEEDELFLSHHAHWLVIRCYECGWNHTIIPHPSENEQGAAVAQAVQEARVTNAA
jgi:hypothetical protein